MATTNEELYEAAKDAATALFSDQSVSQGVTRSQLEDLIGEIRGMIETLE